MAVGWFVVPYARRAGAFPPARYCRMDEFSAAIRIDDGDWREAEALGNRAVVKVRASAATLSAIAATNGLRRLPFAALDTPLSTLTNTQRQALRADLAGAGYTDAEIATRFPGSFGQYTSGDVLRFLVSRRLRPRWDEAVDAIVLDGEAVAGGDLDDADRVRDA